MLARHVSLRQRLTRCHSRRVSTILPPKSRRPSTRTRTEQANDGLPSFIHHFAPQNASSIELVKRIGKPISLQQHLARLARARTKEHEPVKAETEVPPVRRARKSKEPGHPKSGLRSSTAVTTSRTRKARRSPTAAHTPPRVSLRADQTKHHDLATFQAYAAARNLNPASTVFRGTNFEYVVRQALGAYHFDLHRTGKANDLGIDLLGQWALPQDVAATGTSTGSRVLKVLVQCKLSTAQPCNVRELEGAYVGAPAGWRGDGVMAFLVSSKPATAGVRAALQRSRLPMAFLQITEQGQVRQFVWNNIAQEARLVGMSATNAYGNGPTLIPEGNIALVYQGRPL